MFRHIGPQLGFVHRLVWANLWLFGPVLKSRLARLADQVLLFEGGRIERADLNLFHGVNERMGIANFAEIVAFYRLLVVNCQECDP